MITLENDKLSVKIGSGRGARIESFRDLRTGKEWVWKPGSHNRHTEHEDVDLNAAFDDNWAGGWEEVFPNDAATRVLHYDLKDHGEVWRKSWAVDKIERHENKVSFSHHCETYPLTIRKELRLHRSEPELKINYEITSRANEDLPFIYKFHPALAIEPHDEFQMPDARMEPVALGFSRILGSEKKTTYPFGEDKDGRTVSLSKVLPHDSYTREFVKLSEIGAGHCRLRNPRTQTELVFEFSKETLPYLWLFQSYGGFMNHYVAMMEPMNAHHYDLNEIHREGKATIIRPHEKVVFAISIKLNSL